MNLGRIDKHEMNIELLDSDTRFQGLTKVDEEVDDPPFSWKSPIFRKELKTNLTMAFPVLITNIFQYLLNIETMAFCGRLEAVDLEGVGLAISIITALGWCACSGMSTACDTMFAQAFGSADKKRTGLFLQRGLLLLNLIPIFLIGIHVNMEPILILLGQDPTISRVTGQYLKTFCPGLLFMMNYIIFARFMQDQGCLWPPVIAGFSGNLFNILTQLLFVWYLGYGVQAAAICHSFSFAVMLLCELMYIFKTKFYKATWPGFQLEAFYDWSHMFRLGIAGVAQVTFEVIIWEGNVFLGGIIGSIELATQSIMLQLLNLLFVFYYGAGISSNIRVGQCLGANKPNQAKAAYRAGIITIAGGVLIVATLMISLRYQIPYIFTDKTEVIDMVVDVFPLVYVILFIDPFSAVGSAALRGCGRQAIGSLVMFTGFYIVALPINVVLAFVFNFGIKGLWIGTSIGEALSVSLTYIVLECQNWNKQASMAQKRILQSAAKKMNKHSHIETQPLLKQLFVDDETLCASKIHIRTPSYPITCSTEIVDIPEPRTNVQRSMVYKKLLLQFSIVIFMTIGVFIHIFLPTEIYRGKLNSTNN